MEHNDIIVDAEQAVVLPEREALSYADVTAINHALGLNLGWGGSAEAYAEQTIRVMQ